MKLGICNEMFTDWSLPEIFAFVAQTGYQGIEIAPFTLADSVKEITSGQRKQIRTLAKQYHLGVIGTHWLLVKPEGLSLTAPDSSIRGKTSQYLQDLVVFTEEIGGEIMVLGSPRQRSRQPQQTEEEVTRYLSECLSPAMEEARHRGVVICLEPLSRQETNFINTAEQAIEFIRKLGHPSLALILDVKAMSDEDKPIPDIVRAAKQYLRHFHLNDTNLLGPGWGQVDFQPIIGALREINYQHWASVEVFDFSPGAENIARHSYQYLSQVLSAGEKN
ncbi:MAG: sugar phosphate isomerase/epimerase [Candidatus Omnitrophica bacterium]|nr:sugar phosphate isomerase/epimerase [Candidatus Omnitrophota bacterium]